jgi:hypothetical protein
MTQAHTILVPCWRERLLGEGERGGGGGGREDEIMRAFWRESRWDHLKHCGTNLILWALPALYTPTGTAGPARGTARGRDGGENKGQTSQSLTWGSISLMATLVASCASHESSSECHRCSVCSFVGRAAARATASLCLAARAPEAVLVQVELLKQGQACQARGDRMRPLVARVVVAAAAVKEWRVLGVRNPTPQCHLCRVPCSCGEERLRARSWQGLPTLYNLREGGRVREGGREGGRGVDRRGREKGMPSLGMRSAT